MAEWEVIVTRAWGQVAARLEEALKELLEHKHLYQSLTLAFDDVVPIVREDRNPLYAQLKHLKEAIGRPWFVADPASAQHPIGESTYLLLEPRDLKLFCGTCDRTEAFNLVSTDEFLKRGGEADLRDRAGTTQAFILSYRCQSCKGVPEIFVVRRNGLKLTNVGRSPIEHVDVPATIPKSIRRFYSGAIVAHQSGQTLAALFLLRTLIEQWSRLATGTAATFADQVLTAYMESLPADFKGRFASLNALYGDLSGDLHTATGSSDLFDRAKAEISEHFDARRLFRLPADGPQA